MNKKVIIIDEMHESLLTMLEERNVSAIYLPHAKRSEVLDVVSEFDGIFIRSKTSIDKEFIDKANHLKFIARAGAGIEKMDLDYLEKKNITWVNAPEGNRDSLGEHAVGVLLSLLHKLHKADHQVRNRIWNREENRGLN